MISAKAPNPNCGYAWMDYITSPEAQAAVAEYFGEAPANTKACDLTADKALLRHLPRAGRGLRRPDPVLDHADRAVPGRPRPDIKCTDYGDWTTAWTEIKG